MNLVRKSLSGLVAFGAVLAMPLAFAQSAPTTSTDPAAAQATPPTTTTQNAEPSAQPPGAQPKQVTWADLDADKDGNLSKQEVTTVPSLTQVFDEADTDKDGKLTADEYKAYAAKGTATPGNTGG
ncbi:EF-hand domain-containing protein [Luteimonas aquatica]|uniref:EF-hand domain-containing protein n=1 Tax=Luteimonas aquatica TaxID=450364 RepID=UPI001F586469|nr:EF-hand domain-containing protein [Luteimonas aquatica]